jgi:hypothetical protein
MAVGENLLDKYSLLINHANAKNTDYWADDSLGD